MFGFRINKRSHDRKGMCITCCEPPKREFYALFPQLAPLMQELLLLLLRKNEGTLAKIPKASVSQEIW